MSWQIKLFIAATVVMIVAATLQNGQLITSFGMKPNLVLILCAVFVFFIPRFLPYMLLVLLGGALLRFSAGFSWDIVALTIVAFLFYYVRDRFLSSGLIGSLVFVVFGTILFYLLLSPAFVYHTIEVMAKELMYNVTLGALLFSLTRFIYEKKGGSSLR